MKKILFLSLIMVTTLLSCGGTDESSEKGNQKSVFADTLKNTFKITGVVLNPLDSGDVVLTKPLAEGQSKEIGRAKTTEDGKFVIEGKINKSDIYVLNIYNQQQFLVMVEDRDIQVEASGLMDSVNYYKVTGTSEDGIFYPLNDILNKMTTEMMALREKYMAKAKNEGADFAFLKKQMYDEANLVSQKYKSDIKELMDEANAPFSLLLLSSYWPIEENSEFYQKALDRMDFSKIENGDLMADDIRSKLSVMIGSKAPDFTVESSVEGDSITLSSLRGKYVLLDFWASWCGPCRAENPNIKTNYEKYKDAGFEVLSISTDKPSQRGSWKSAMEKDQMTWSHGIVNELYEPAATYSVTQIPKTFLLDKEGKIIALDLRGPQLSAKLKEIFGF